MVTIPQHPQTRPSPLPPSRETFTVQQNFVKHVAVQCSIPEPERKPWNAAAPRHVYYTSYGSNMSKERFEYYLHGGTPPFASRTYPGCRDTTPPQHVTPILLHGQLHFAGRSTVWDGGGVLFLDFQQPACVLGRAYLITIEQLYDVIRQENAGKTLDGRHQPDVGELLHSSKFTSPCYLPGGGAYDTIIYAGVHQGHPVVTFSAPFTVADALQGAVKYGDWEVHTNKPSPAYLHHLHEGLHQTYPTVPSFDDYFRGMVGHG